MTDLALLDAVDQADLVRRGEVTATELVEAAISRIELLNPALNAVIFTSYEEALARAAARPSGRFAGVPYLLKNLVVERAGTPFTEGRDRRLDDEVERARKTVSARIRDALSTIALAHPALGSHLRISTVLGVRCSYQSNEAIRWELGP